MSVERLCVLISNAIMPPGMEDEVPAELREPITSETLLLEQGLLDSLAIVSLVGMVETEFGVEIPESGIVAANFRTPRHLWTYICALSEAGIPASDVG